MIYILIITVLYNNIKMHVWYACILNSITNKCICKGPFENVNDADSSIEKNIKDVSTTTMLLRVCKFQPSWLINYKLKREINNYTKYTLKITNPTS